MRPFQKLGDLLHPDIYICPTWLPRLRWIVSASTPISIPSRPNGVFGSYSLINLATVRDDPGYRGGSDVHEQRKNFTNLARVSICTGRRWLRMKSPMLVLPVRRVFWIKPTTSVSMSWGRVWFKKVSALSNKSSKKICSLLSLSDGVPAIQPSSILLL